MALLLNIGDTVQRSYSYTKPSPTHISQPQECGDRTGNLFDDNNAEYGKWVNSDGTLATYSTYAAGYDIKVGTASEFAIKHYGDKPYSYSMAFYDSNGDFLSRVHRSSPSNSYDTFPVPENAISARFQVAVSPGVVMTSAILKAMKLMLNTGSTALPYEPYGYKIPITLAGQTQTVYLNEPLRKIGDYADKIEASGTTGTVTRRIKERVLTGQENLYINDGVSTEDTAYFYTTAITQNTYVEGHAVCTHFEYKDVYRVQTENGFHLLAGYGGLRFRLIRSIAGTVNAFKQWLADEYSNGTPVTVWYVLANPVTEQTTVPTLTPTKGSNTLTVGTTLQPSEVSITGGIRQQ